MFQYNHFFGVSIPVNGVFSLTAEPKALILSENVPV